MKKYTKTSLKEDAKDFKKDILQTSRGLGKITKKSAKKGFIKAEKSTRKKIKKVFTSKKTSLSKPRKLVGYDPNPFTQRVTT